MDCYNCFEELSKEDEQKELSFYGDGPLCWHCFDEFWWREQEKVYYPEESS